MDDIYGVTDFGFEEKPIEVFPTRRILVLENPHLKMLYYARASRGEVSGLGKVKITKDEVVITDAILIEQECSGSETTLDEEMLSKFIVDSVKRGETLRDYRLWWHSHNDFGVFWSSTDEDTIKKLSRNRVLISLCINKRGEMVSRFDRGSRREDLLFIPNDKPKLRRECKEEVKKKVTYHNGREGIVNGLYETAEFDKNGRIKRFEDDDNRVRSVGEFFRSDSF